jgi:phosphoribosylaminoimidazole (AIR) synthetase
MLNVASSLLHHIGYSLQDLVLAVKGMDIWKKDEEEEWTATIMNLLTPTRGNHAKFRGTATYRIRKSF